MLETVLTAGSDAGWLPFHETGSRGSGGLCSLGTQNAIHNGQHKYLPFCPNGINWVASGGEDVISYNFSGCTMAAFDHGGIRKVCHVSTGGGQDCSAAWATIKAASTNVVEFTPHAFIDLGVGNFNGCYGLITASGDLYSITVDRVEITKGRLFWKKRVGEKRKIYALKRATPL